MPISKLRALIFLGLNLLGLVACNIPAPQQRDANQAGNTVATFFITDANGTSMPAKLTKDMAVPQNKTFNFTVCLKGQAQSKPLIGHPFRIEELNKELKTDEKGCLNWNEDIAFNFFSEPKYLNWQRQITATGLHKGTRTARFAINPWNENDNSQTVVNLDTVTPPKLISDYEQIQETLSGSSENLRMPRNPLWINDLRFQSTDQKLTHDAVHLNFELMALPQLQVSKLNGEKAFRPLTNGQFKLKIYLIHILMEDNKEIHSVLSESVPQTVGIQGNNLFVKVPLKLTAIPTRGQLALGLDVSTESLDENIRNFQGVYMIGDYDQLKGSGFLKLMSTVTESPGFKISTFINSKLEDKPLGNKDTYVKPGIEIAPLEFKYLRVGKETTSDREIVYNIKACLKNGVDQKITRGYTFNVNGFRQHKGASANITPKILKITTDNSSCINWDETMSFKYYKCQKYRKGFIEIENKDLALKQKLEIAINPWATAGTFARDLRYVDDQERLLTDCKKENVLPSVISLKTLTYSKLSYDYEIDSLLNFTFKKKLQFKIDASVNIFSDTIKGRMESQKLRPGIYLLKLALIKNRDYYNQKTYVSSAEKIVASLDGDIKTEIEFKTADLKALKEQSTLLIELDPVKEDKITIGKDGKPVPKEKTESLDDLIDRDTGLYNRTFSTSMSLNADTDFKELTAIEPRDANQYLTNENAPRLDETHKSIVREYIRYGQNLAAENLQAQKAQSDIGVFAENNSLKQISVAENRGSEGLRAALATAPTRMSESQVKKELGQVATTGKINTGLSKGLCTYWFKSLIAKELWSPFDYHAYAVCDLHANQPEQLFTVEKRLFVKELAAYKFIRGRNATISVGDNISLTKSASHSTATTASVSLNMGLLKSFTEFFSIGISGSYAISQADSKAEAMANSVSVNENISLQMEKNIYQLKFKRYQECSVVKINPKQFMKNGLFASALNPKLKDDEKAAVASLGLLICTGRDNTSPLTRLESYYLLSQDNSNTKVQDNGDARNFNFFFALRGEKAYQRLMYFLKGSIKMPQAADRASDEQKNIFTNLDVLFNSGSANVPGSYNDSP